MEVKFNLTDEIERAAEYASAKRVADVPMPPIYENHAGKWIDVDDCTAYAAAISAVTVVQEPLQEDEILALFLELNKPNKFAKTPVEMFIRIVRAIEARHGICTTGGGK